MSDSVLSGYITPKELAQDLGIDVRSLQRWASLGLGPPLTDIGKKRVYSRASVLAWLAEQERKRPRRRAERTSATTINTTE
jgi:DNA-binding transcriptional MerR regulator